MSKLITMYWECPACKRENRKDAKKPGLFRPSTLSVKCDLCENTFLMSVIKGPQLGKVAYSFIEGSAERPLTEKEIDTLLDSVNQKLNPSKDDNTKEQENDNTNP